MGDKILMEYDTSIVRDIIRKYATGRISRRELGTWAFSAYEDLLKGGYLALKKLAVYPFLKTLSSFCVEAHEIADQYPAAREEVDRAYDILSGRKSSCFTVEIAASNRFFTMPAEQYSRMNELYEYVLHLEGGINEQTGAKNPGPKAVNLRRGDEPKTIYDLIEWTAFELFDASFDIQEGVYRRKASLRLYSPASQEFVPLKRLTQCFDTLRNNADFCFLIRFNKGVPDISLLM